MPLVNCVNTVSGTGGGTLTVTAAVYPNCSSGLAYTTTTYLLSLETKIIEMQQSVADSQAATLLSNSQLASCNTLLSGSGSCPAVNPNPATYSPNDLLLGTNVYTLGDMAYVLVLAWGLGRILLYVRQFSFSS